MVTKKMRKEVDQGLVSNVSSATVEVDDKLGSQTCRSAEAATKVKPDAGGRVGDRRRRWAAPNSLAAE